MFELEVRSLSLIISPVQSSEVSPSSSSSPLITTLASTPSSRLLNWITWRQSVALSLVKIIQKLCSDWFGSQCYFASSLMP